MPYVVVKWCNEEVHRAELTGPMTIGREIGVDVWINDPVLSRKHCVIEQDRAGLWFVIDLRSRNGIYVNDTRVTRRVLSDGDCFRLGQAIVRFHEGEFQSRRAATPDDAMFESRMERSDMPVSGRATALRPASAATISRPAKQTIRPAKVSLLPKPGEPLVQPFGLAFKRPPAQPSFEGMSPPAQVSDSQGKSRGWIASCLFLLRSRFTGDRDVA